MNIFLDLLARMFGKKKSVHPVIEHTPANLTEQDERRRKNFQKSFDKAKSELEKFFVSHHLSDRCYELGWDDTNWKVEVSTEDFVSLIIMVKPEEIVFESFYHGLGDTHTACFSIISDSNIYIAVSRYGLNLDHIVELGEDTTRPNDASASWTGKRVTRNRLIWK